MSYAELPGVRLHYEEAGAGPPLVLLHGIGASCKDWEYNIPAFAKHYPHDVRPIQSLNGRAIQASK